MKGLKKPVSLLLVLVLLLGLLPGTTLAAGVRTFTCSCGETYTESIDALGHSWGGWRVTSSATATRNGTETRTCSVCNATETRSIPATGSGSTGGGGSGRRPATSSVRPSGGSSSGGTTTI